MPARPTRLAAWAGLVAGFAGAALAATTADRPRADPPVAAPQPGYLISIDSQGRVQVAPNATNAVPSRVVAWLDLRAADEPALDALLADIERGAVERAGRDGTRAEVGVESRSPAVGRAHHFSLPIAGGWRGRCRERRSRR